MRSIQAEMKLAKWQLVLVLLGRRVDADCCDHIAISSNSHGDALGEHKFTIYNSTILNLKASKRKRLPGAPAWGLFKGESGNSNRLTTLALQVVGR